jgi:hypothetical protein
MSISAGAVAGAAMNMGLVAENSDNAVRPVEAGERAERCRLLAGPLRRARALTFWPWSTYGAPQGRPGGARQPRAGRRRSTVSSNAAAPNTTPTAPTTMPVVAAPVLALSSSALFAAALVASDAGALAARARPVGGGQTAARETP